MVEIPGDLFFDDAEGAVLVYLSWLRGVCVLVVHGDVAVGIRSMLAVLLLLRWWLFCRVEPGCLVVVRGDDGDFVGVVTG